MSIRKRFNPNRIAFVSIIALAVLLRVLFLGKESLWWDEAVSVHIAGLDWSRFWPALAEEHNMDFYYLLLHFWMNLGRSEFMLRALSVLFAALTVPLFYSFGVTVFGPRTGLLAMLLLALNAYHLRYSQEARSYALVVLLVTLSSLFFVAGVQRPSWKAWGSYTATAVLAVYSHFFAVLVLLAQWISVVLLRRRDVPWRFLVTSACVIGLLLVPAAFFGLTKDTGQINWIPRTPPDSVPRALVYLAGATPVSEKPVEATFFRVAELARRLLLLLYMVFLGAAITSAARRWGSVRRSFETWKYGFLVAWLLVPPVFAYAFSMVKPIFIYYYLIVSLPPLVFVAAAGLSGIRQPQTFAAVLILFVGLAGVQLLSYYHYARKEDWRGATAYILSRAQPGDGVVFYYEYCCNRDPRRIPSQAPPTIFSVDPGPRAAYEYYRDQRIPSQAAPTVFSVDDLQRDRSRRVWLVLSHSGSLDRVVEAEVASNRRLAEQREFFGNIRVLLYTMPR